MSRIPLRIGVSIELLDESDIKAGLFFGFPHRGNFQRLSIIDKATRQRPAVRRIFSFNQDNSAAGDFDDSIHRRQWGSRFFTHKQCLP